MVFLLDDDWDNDPRVSRAGTAAFGLYCRCGAWSARHLTDGNIPAEIVSTYGTREWTAKLVEVGLFEITEAGFRMPHYLTRNPSAEKAKARRAINSRKQALFRDPELRLAVRNRDQDRCRYCNVAVRWSDRRGRHGGTYDHVDPDGPNDFDNLVVACRSCNSSKRNRTPAAAGMTLLPAPPIQVGSRSKQVSQRPHFPPSKEGEGGGRNALRAIHAFDDDGTGHCLKCPLPYSNEIHGVAS